MKLYVNVTAQSKMSHNRLSYKHYLQCLHLDLYPYKSKSVVGIVQVSTFDCEIKRMKGRERE